MAAARKKSTAKKAAKKPAAKKAAAKKPAKKAAAKKPAKKAAAKKKPAKKAAKAPAPAVRLPTSQIKAYMRDAHGLRVSGEFADSLNAEIAATLDRVATRTKSNNRATVKAGDL